MHNLFLAKNPLLYSFITKFKKCVNYEKLLYIRKIKKADIVLDIGANQGYYTSLFSILTGQYGQVHGFEPIPESFKKLEQLKSSCKNVVLNNIAIGEKQGSASISYDPMDSEKASLLNSRNTYPNKFITEVNSIDNYMIDRKLDNIDFIKCDVEGFELNVLKGAYESVTKFSPDISMEMTSNQDDTIEIINLLKKAGYNKFYKIEKGFPIFDINKHNFIKEEYFYLYANS